VQVSWLPVQVPTAVQPGQ
jgi:hypothetical protein